MADADLSMYDGDAVPLAESSVLAGAFPVRVVLIMGDKDAGKTTLLAVAGILLT